MSYRAGKGIPSKEDEVISWSNSEEVHVKCGVGGNELKVLLSN